MNSSVSGNPYQEIRDLIQRAKKIYELRNIIKIVRKRAYGSWNYEKMEFIMSKSSFLLTREIGHKYISFIDNVENVKQENENTIFNQDYQNTQNFFNLGCDFRILTPTFKDIEVYPLSMPISVRVD